MGKIRRAIADFIRSWRVDDKRHPRFQAGYLAGLNDARLEAETTHEDGIIRLEKRPEEHVLWYHGEIVWRSGSGTMPEIAAPWAAQHVAPPKNSGNLRLEVRSNPCAGDTAYGGADPRALKYDTSRALPPHDPDTSPPSSHVPGNPSDEWAISQAQLHSACLSFRHDFGLLNESERASVMLLAREWLTAWRKALATTEGSAT